MSDMKLLRHKIQEIPFVKARDTGGKIKPELVVLHDTAGRLDKGNSVKWLEGNPGKSSVHFVIERDGSITQMVPTNRRANHAGKSSYHGRDWVNGFSIGIEIVNPGLLRQSPRHPGKAVAWYGQEFEAGRYDIQSRETPEHGYGLWMGYTPEQIDAVSQLLEVLFAKIPTLRDIRTHWYVSPGRKVDTNPLFPLDQIRARILGRDDPIGQEADIAADPAFGDEFVEIDVPNSALNMRKWPSFNRNVITSIPDGVRVPVLLAGNFAGREWLKVVYGGQEGWIVAAYTAHPAQVAA